MEKRGPVELWFNRICTGKPDFHPCSMFYVRQPVTDSLPDTFLRSAANLLCPCHQPTTTIKAGGSQMAARTVACNVGTETAMLGSREIVSYRMLLLRAPKQSHGNTLRVKGWFGRRAAGAKTHITYQCWNQKLPTNR